MDLGITKTFVLVVVLLLPAEDGQVFRIQGTKVLSDGATCWWALLDKQKELLDNPPAARFKYKIECVPYLDWLAKFARPI